METIRLTVQVENNKVQDFMDVFAMWFDLERLSEQAGDFHTTLTFNAEDEEEEDRFDTFRV